MHSYLFTEKALFAAGVFGYTLTSAKRSETYADLIQVSITSIFSVKPEEERRPLVARAHFDEMLRGLLSTVPELRFVCVDSVRTVFGATDLESEISRRFAAK
jgi:hypothetical protein